MSLCIRKVQKHFLADIKTKRIKNEKENQSRRLECDSCSNDKGQLICHLHQSSSLKKVPQNKSSLSGESNDRCFGGGGERNSLVNQLDNPHTVDPPHKRKKNI